MKEGKETVLVAMSGGVDSSLAAALLVEQGHRVIGATMKTFCYADHAGPSRTCCGLDGILDARAICDRLGIPHYVFDMEEAFTRAVIDDFVDEYVAGRTPNPCVRCNSNTKIPDLLRKARLLGAETIATGHYARTRPDGRGGVEILRGADPAKDQSYFLWGVPAEVAARLRFPDGELTKAEVRERARQLGLDRDKPESQEICFVPTGDYTDFLAQRPVGPPRPRRDRWSRPASGSESAGYARYTVGQRRARRRVPQALYVLGPPRDERGRRRRGRPLRDEVTLIDLNWIARLPTPGENFVQLR